MRSTIEPVEANKVKVRVEIDSAEFEKDINAAFKRIAKEVKLPGFRPGKAPRKLLEARLGANVGRQEALREALPTYYSLAVVEHEVDVIAPPQIEITNGEESGDVAFDAVVEVRPSISVPGYRSLRVEVPSPLPNDDEIESQIDRLRDQFATLETVERPVADGDQVTIDIAGSYEGEAVPGLTATDYLYEVGKGAVVPEIDENLRGRAAGEVVTFDAAHPDANQEGRIEFSVTVKQVQQKVLPPVDDDFARQASEFDTAAELRADIERNLSRQKRFLANLAVRNRASQELVKLVEDEVVPAAMIEAETQSRVENLVMRLRSQRVSIEQWMQATGRQPAEVMAQAREEAAESAKLDLALRAIGESESIEVTEEDIDDYLKPSAEKANVDLETARERIAKSGQMPSVRADILKSKALDWLVKEVEIVDTDGTVIDREALALEDEAASQDQTNEDD